MTGTIPGRRQVYNGRRVIVDFELNRGLTGIAGIAVGTELRASIHHFAEHVAKPLAISLSPVSKRQHKHYIASFEVHDRLLTGFPRQWPMTRAASDLVNTAPHAIIVEIGAEKTPAHRVLRKTLARLNRVRRGN